MKFALTFLAGALLGAALTSAPSEAAPAATPRPMSDRCAWAVNEARAVVAVAGCEADVVEHGWCR